MTYNFLTKMLKKQKIAEDKLVAIFQPSYDVQYNLCEESVSCIYCPPPKSYQSFGITIYTVYSDRKKQYEYSISVKKYYDSNTIETQDFFLLACVTENNLHDVLVSLKAYADNYVNGGK